MARTFQTNVTTGKRKTSLGCLFAFLTPLFAIELFFLWGGIRNIQEGKGWGVAGFAILSLALASAFLMFGIRSHRTNIAQIKFQEEHKDTPWLWKPEWRTGHVRSNDSKAAIILWIMAIAFIGLSLPAVLAIPKEWDKDNKLILIALVFPVAGFGLGIAATRSVIRMRKFGRSELELHTLPGVLGGTFSGSVEIPSKVNAEDGFKVRLLCVRRTTSGSGKNRSTHEHVEWEEEKTLLKEYLVHERDKTGLPVFFNLPYSLSETKNGNPAIVWRLEINAAVPGVDYATQFEVPVFVTSESHEDFKLQQDPTASFQPAPEDWKPPTNTRIRVQETLRGKTEIYFPPARNVPAILGLLVFLTIWSGAIWFMIEEKAPLMFPIVFGLFDLLIMIFVFQMLFHSVKTVASRTEINVRHRFLLLTWKRKLQTGDIKTIELKKGMQCGSKVYYNLRATLQSGRSCGLGGLIPNKKHAEWLADQLREALGRG